MTDVHAKGRENKEILRQAQNERNEGPSPANNEGLRMTGLATQTFFTFRQGAPIP